MIKDIFAMRRDRVRTLMEKESLDILLVSHAANRYYLSGFELHDPQFNESAGRLLVLADGQDILCTDPRYTDAAKRLWSEKNLLIYGQDGCDAIVEKLMEISGGRPIRIGFEARIVNLDFYERLFKKNNLLPVKADGLVEYLRRFKDEEEIQCIEKSCRLNQEVMEWLPSILESGKSEADIAWQIEIFFREHGASELAFASIVARGTNAALPHAIPSDQAIIGSEDMVLVDIGCRLHDYCSDQTRTFWIGQKPSQRFQDTLKLVQEAQSRSIDAIRPGIMVCDVYSIARNLFAQHNIAKAFTHGLGHGVGLETHEGPSLSSKVRQRLEPGMVITVEPGLYDASWGGIRWEHMILVTESGHRILGCETK